MKAAAVGTDPARMFMDMGRIPASELKSAMESSELDTLPGLLPEAVAEAKNVLDTTRDPQLSDITLDGWMYRDMARTRSAPARVPPGLRGGTDRRRKFTQPDSHPADGEKRRLPCGRAP